MIVVNLWLPASLLLQVLTLMDLGSTWLRNEWAVQIGDKQDHCQRNLLRQTTYSCERKEETYWETVTKAHLGMLYDQEGKDTDF